MCRHRSRFRVGAALTALALVGCTSTPVSTLTDSSNSDPIASESVAADSCSHVQQSAEPPEPDSSMPAQDPVTCRFSPDDLSRGVVLAIEGIAPLTRATLFEPFDLDEYPESEDDLALSGSAVIQEATGAYDNVVIVRGDAFCYREPTVRAEIEGDVVVISVQRAPVDSEMSCDAAEIDVAIGLTFDRSAGFDSDVVFRS